MKERKIEIEIDRKKKNMERNNKESNNDTHYYMQVHRILLK